MLICLKECNGDKAPNPDSFHMKFYQEFWEVIKVEVMAVFHDFHSSGSFIQSINSTFLEIIPKIVGANNIKDFRLISLVESLYKLIANVLARRMSKVLGEVIAENQNVFVAGRQILDAVMVANEVVDDMVERKERVSFAKLIWRRPMTMFVGTLLFICSKDLVLERDGGNGL